MHMKQPHMFFVALAVAILKFIHLGHYFLKPGDFADISISPALCSKCRAVYAYVQSAGQCRLKQRVTQSLEIVEV
jgi:hypothetical protein